MFSYMKSARCLTNISTAGMLVNIVIMIIKKMAPVLHNTRLDITTYVKSPEYIYLFWIALRGSSFSCKNTRPTTSAINRFRTICKTINKKLQCVE